MRGLMRGWLMAVAVAWLAACGPAPTPAGSQSGSNVSDIPVSAPPVTGSEPEAAACAARGGTIRPVCMMGTPQCVVTYADAGQVCRDGDECEGDCRAEAIGPADAPAVGRCQANSDPCGCFANVEGGRIDAALCVD